MQRTGFETSRRAFVTRLGAVAVAGALAGCSGDDVEPTGSATATSTERSTDTRSGPDTGTPTATGESTPTATAEPTATPTGEPTPTATPSLEEYLAGAYGYDGSIADWTGDDEVSVTVGAGDQGFRFAPVGIRIGVGTTVTWEWEAGARHNVVAADGSFDSGEPVVSDEKTFAHTFAEAGTRRYHCEPHVDVGMKGVVVVEA